MFCSNMTAPSITVPHARCRGLSITQSKLYSHGRIYIVPLAQLLSLGTLFSPALFLSSWCLSFNTSCLFFIFTLGPDDRHVQSFFNGAKNYISSGLVHSCCPLFSQYKEAPKSIWALFLFSPQLLLSLGFSSFKRNTFVFLLLRHRQLI